MANLEKNDEFESWYPTYGVLTAERILGRYHIKLDYKALVTAVKNPGSIYYQLLKVPLKNVYSGILMDHAAEYQSYVQKLFVDYFISGQADMPEDSPGQSTRESLEQMRINLKSLNESFEVEQTQRRELIAKSQSLLMKHGRDINSSLKKAVQLIVDETKINEGPEQMVSYVHTAIAESGGIEENAFKKGARFWNALSEQIHINLDEVDIDSLANSLHFLVDKNREILKICSPIQNDADDMINTMRNAKKSFYQLILKVKEKISNLPEYRDGEERAESNLSQITFDPEFGEQKG